MTLMDLIFHPLLIFIQNKINRCWKIWFGVYNFKLSQISIPVNFSVPITVHALDTEMFLSSQSPWYPKLKA